MTQRPTSVEIAARDLGWKPEPGDRVWTRHMGIKHFRLGVVGNKCPRTTGNDQWWVDHGYGDSGPFMIYEMWPVLR